MVRRPALIGCVFWARRTGRLAESGSASIVAVTVTGSLECPTLSSRRDADSIYRPSTLRDCCDDITVVDMGDLPESEVSIPELSDLTRKWPPAVLAHMRWRQPELEEMQQAAKLQYRKKQPVQCDFCSRTIRCDMYRHVAHCHLDLAQLWRCPVAWCTIWKGALQDLTDHVRYAHRVPEEVQNVRLEKIIPPWTVTWKVLYGVADIPSLRNIERHTTVQ